MQTQRKGLRRAFEAGAGLASPGRWKAPARRLPDNEVARELGEAFSAGLLRMSHKMEGGSLGKVLISIMGGNLVESTFPEAEVDKLREEVRAILVRRGFGDGRGKPGDAMQPTEVRLIQELLKAFQDPDAHFCESGLRVRREIRLPSDGSAIPRGPHHY